MPRRPKNKLVLSGASDLVFESIKCFESAKGKGRDKNDANNKLREKILSLMTPLSPTISEFVSTKALTLSPCAAQWRHIYDAWTAALKMVAADHGVPDPRATTVRHKGGRGARSDFEVIFEDAAGNKHTAMVEFKFNSMPQFINLPANKPLHPHNYAQFYYDKYLDKVLEMYDIPLTEKPSYETYAKYLYCSEYSKHPLFARLKAAEDAAKLATPAQAPVVRESIAEYLKEVVDSTNCEELTREFESQINKHFLIYKNETFHHDMYSKDEMTVRRVVGIVNENTLVTESMKEGTFHHLLLRWKNHLGVMYPAWQIKLVRAVPTAVLKHRKK